MKLFVVFLFFLAGYFKAHAQNNILSQMGFSRIQTFNWVEQGNSFYFISFKEAAITQPISGDAPATAYTLEKWDKHTLQKTASVTYYADTLQADSIVYWYSMSMAVAQDKIHIVYNKRIEESPSYGRMNMCYMQLDTNLTITVPERQLEYSGVMIQQILPFQNKGLLVAYHKNDPVNPFSSYSRFIILDNSGNQILADTFSYKPAFVPGAPSLHRVVEVNPFPGNRYLVSGESLLPIITHTRGFYLADSNLNVLDTFYLPNALYTNANNEAGDIYRFPNLKVLPSCSVIGGGMYLFDVQNKPSMVKSVIFNLKPENRYVMDTFMVYGQADSNDVGHTVAPSMHSLEYNPADNLIYYADVTHKDILGQCVSSYNYVQIICADTNLNTRWRKYIYFGPDRCSFVTRVSKCDDRPGVLVVGTSGSTVSNNPSLTQDFVFYIDSAGSGLSVPQNKAEGLRDRVVVYPNPAKDLVYIDDLFGKLDQLMVYDVRGRLLHHQKLDARRATFHAGALPPGLLIFKILTKDQQILYKRIIKD